MSLRSGSNQKKPVSQEQYNQERGNQIHQLKLAQQNTSKSSQNTLQIGFETFLHGANQQRISQKRTTDKKDNKNQSKERKKWQEQQEQQEQQQQQAKQQYVKVDIQLNKNDNEKKEEGQRQKWNKLPPNNQNSKNDIKGKQQQNLRNVDGESIMNYIQTMDRDELEILRQSLVGQNLQAGRRGNYSPSPNKAMMVEEDENLKYQYYNEDDESDEETNTYKNEGFDNIEEEIEENLGDNQSGLYKPDFNERSYHTSKQMSYKQPVSVKARPISAIESNKYGQNLYSNNNLKNYESSHNIGTGGQYGNQKQRENSHDEKRIIYNEETSKLNSNPFNMKGAGRRQSENVQITNKNVNIQEIPINLNKNQNKKEIQQPKHQERDKGLDDLVMKLSKMNEGVRQELATLIDKIGNGELDVSAIKSLLFMQNNNSNQSLNTNASAQSEQIKDQQQQHNRIQSEPHHSSHKTGKNPQNSIEKYNQQNYEENLNVRRDLFGGEEAKPETIKFSRDQFSISLSKGLLQNTQELERTLNLGNDNLREKASQKDKGNIKQLQFKSNIEEDSNNKMELDKSLKQKKDDNKHHSQNNLNYSNQKDENQLKKLDGLNKNDSEEEYFEEEELEEEPINQNLFNKLNKNKLKDTLQMKNQKEQQQQQQQALQQNEMRKPSISEEPTSERSNKKQEPKTSNQENKTYNLSKNKEKQVLLKEIKELKGEVFIIIRVISTWGSAHLVGLTEIKVYDEEGTAIKLKPEDFMIEGGPQTSLRNIHKICDGVYDTIDPEHMWLGTMPDPPKCMEIGIKFKSSKGIGAVRIWNYNKSLIDSVKGIKEVEIIRKNQLVWAGQVKKGLGKEHENYGDIIRFKEDLVLDDEKKAVVRISQQQGVVSTKASVNMSKEIKNSLKQEEKPPTLESQNKLPQKKQLPQQLEDVDMSKQGRQRGNLPSQSSNSTPQGSNRIRSAQQKPALAPLSKDNEESETSLYQIPTSVTSNNKKNIETKFTKETEVDSLTKAVQAKNQAQKQGSLPTRRQNETSSSTTSLTSQPGQSKFVGTSNFELKNKIKLDDNKTPTSQGSGKTTPSNALLTSSNQASTEPSIDPITAKSNKKGPKVLNVFEEKQSKNQLSSQSSFNNKDAIQSESPIQKKTLIVEYKEDKTEQNFDKKSEQIIKLQNENNERIEKDLKDPQKKSSDDSNSGKVDDFMENVKFFNATHQGRFQPAERERILQSQANDVQQAVKQTLQSLNPFFQQNLGKKGLENESHFKSEDDSGDYNKIDVFMKESTQLQQHLTASIQRSNQERQSQIKQNKPTKPILEDEDWILDQILREENQSDEKDQFNKQQIFAPKKPPTQKGYIASDRQKTDQSAQKQDTSANLDDTHQFEKEMKKLLESKNDPFLNDVLKSVQKESPQLNTQPLNAESFQIPNLPEGRYLKLEIYSTWGDSHYVGLSGIEFFNSKGNVIQIKNPKTQVRADPSDINTLPEYGEDPRTCDKLVDGVYLTCDDLHMWLAPYQLGKINYIYIDFQAVEKLSMIRIWNYNKSRIHSFRGAKDIQIFLDDKPIFAGPISRAEGIQYYAPKDCEYIMFTDKESIIQQIENSDWLNRYQLTEIEEEQNTIEKMLQTQSLQRPTTGNNLNTDSQTSLSSQPRSQTGKDGRPITSAKISSQNLQPIKQDDLNKRLNTNANQIIENQMKQGQPKSLKSGVKCQKIKINILKAWEDKFYVGLTGIEVYDEYGQKIPLKESQIKARPRDLNDISGYQGDQRTLEKLIDGVNLTTNEKHMWLVQLLETPSNYLQIDFMEERVISGIKVWNYNKQQNYYDSKSVEAYRGAKLISIIADENVYLTPQQGILLRKAPGRDLFDYGQMIALPFKNGWNFEIVQSLQLPTQVNSAIIQEYDTIYLPRGFCFRFNIHSTWGDAHYCGLNGIEFYDSFGNPIIEKRLAEFKLGAEPASVNILPGCQGDIRTIDKLVNGQNNTYDDRNMWLAPFINSRSDKNVICPHLKMNTIFVYFEKPVIISAINFWNYSKTPTRGVREIEIFLDDKLIFRGYLKKAPTQEQHAKDQVPLFNSVIFNRNQEIVQIIKPVVYNEDKLQQNVIFHNEGRTDENNRNQQYQQQLQIPNNASNPQVRPQTKVSGMKLQQS